VSIAAPDEFDRWRHQSAAALTPLFSDDDLRDVAIFWWPAHTHKSRQRCLLSAIALLHAGFTILICRIRSTGSEVMGLQVQVQVQVFIDTLAAQRSSLI